MNEMSAGECAERLDKLAFLYPELNPHYLDAIKQASNDEHKLAAGELVEVVKCKDCKYQHTKNCPIAEYEFISPNDTERTWFTPNCGDGFCSDGMRKDDAK